MHAVGEQREPLLDPLRGFALIGILLVNIPFMGRSLEHGLPLGAPSLADGEWQAFLVSQLFIEGTMRGLFTLLFGAGMVLLTKRPPAPGAPSAADVHYRRALALIAFGLVHAHLFLWFGDILYLYGWTALFLFPFRMASPRALFAIAAAGLALMTLGGAGKSFGVTEFYEKGVAAQAIVSAGGQPSDAQNEALEFKEELIAWRAPSPELLEEERLARTGSFGDTLAYHFDSWVEYNLEGFFYLGLLESFSFMLIGVGLLKLGVLTARAPAGVYAALAIGGYGLGVGLSAVEMWIGWRNGFAPGAFNLNAITYEISRLGGTLGHVGLIGLIWRAGAKDWLGVGLTALGRMALTNYLTASIVCAFLFYGIGFGLFGQFSTFALWGIAFVICAAQAILSHLWLRAFRLGPFEWALRAIAYWRLQPIRR